MPKSALVAAEKFYKPKEFKQLLANLRDGLISVTIYEEADVPATCCHIGRAALLNP